MRKLKPQGQRVFDYVATSINENGYAPSVRDIQNALGFKSTSTVHMYLNRLEEFGLIRKEDGKSRAITLEGGTTAADRIPVLGKVTAGLPILAEENFDGFVEFATPTRQYDPKDLFALRVSGTSMIDVGIMDGDYVIVNKTDCAENGEIVVALIEDSATVKTFYREDGHFRLQPENDEYEPILVESLAVLGRVIASMRFY
jgi:repressor LexA